MSWALPAHAFNLSRQISALKAGLHSGILSQKERKLLFNMLEIKCGILGNSVSTPTLASIQHRAATTQQDYRAVTSHAGLICHFECQDLCNINLLYVISASLYQPNFCSRNKKAIRFTVVTVLPSVQTDL